MTANPAEPAPGAPSFETSAEDAAAAYVGPHDVVRPALPSDASPPAKVVLNIPEGRRAGEGEVLALRARRRTATVRLERRELDPRHVPSAPPGPAAASAPDPRHGGEAASTRGGSSHRAVALTVSVLAIVAGAGGIGALLAAKASAPAAPAALESEAALAEPSAAPRALPEPAEAEPGLPVPPAEAPNAEAPNAEAPNAEAPPAPRAEAGHPPAEPALAAAPPRAARAPSPVAPTPKQAKEASAPGKAPRAPVRSGGAAPASKPAATAKHNPAEI